MIEYVYLPNGEYVRKVRTITGRVVITERGTVEIIVRDLEFQQGQPKQGQSSGHSHPQEQAPLDNNEPDDSDVPF